MDNLGPSMRIEKCLDNPHMGALLGNLVVGNAEQRPLSVALQQTLDRALCTRIATGDQHDFQPWFKTKRKYTKKNTRKLNFGLCCKGTSV
jgi:hypothetical protein